MKSHSYSEAIHTHKASRLLDSASHQLLDKQDLFIFASQTGILREITKYYVQQLIKDIP